MRVPPPQSWVAVLAPLVLLQACNKEPDTSPRYNRNLGGATIALPTPATLSDRGILNDPKDYRPSAGPGGPKGPAVTGDEKSQVQALAESLAKAAVDGEIQTILDAFDPAQAEALKSQSSVLFETVEKQQLVEQRLKDKLGEDAMTQLKETGRQMLMASLSIEVQDADNATIAPNLVASLLGPKAAKVMNVARVGGLWKIRLPAALTPEDVDQIVKLNKTIQSALDSLTEQIDSGKLKTLPEIAAAWQLALAGQAPPSAGGAPSTPDTGTQPAPDAGDKPAAPETPEGDDPSNPRVHKKP